jgi:hypothetical protein
MVISLSKKDIEWVSTQYPKLQIDFSENTIIGDIEFNRSYDKCVISDGYTIRISLNDFRYGSILPKVFELSGKIKNTALKYDKDITDLHINNDESLCLTVPTFETEYFNGEFTIREFMENAIVPFLFWQSYYFKYGKAPWGEYAHGSLAFLEMYANDEMGFVDLQNTINIKDLSNMMYHYDCKKDECLCGKEKNMKNCHPLVFNGLKKLRNELFGKKIA